MSKEKRYVIKVIKFNKEKEKDLIQLAEELISKRCFSYHIKKLLYETFISKKKDEETLKILKEIKNRLESGNISAVKAGIETLEKHTEGKSISQLMGDMLDESDEEEDLF